MRLFVTQVVQASPPMEDQSDDPVVPSVTGGEVLVTALVTAESEEGWLKFPASIKDRAAVGDEVHVRVDHVPLDKP